jgi:hypothetical protein
VSTQELDGSSRTASVPNLIAWLSLCLLAAAWGRQLDKRLQDLWGQVGAFGLTAAVGLASLEKTRSRQQEQVREQSLRLHFDDKLAELNDHNSALESISHAIRRLTKDAESGQHSAVSKPLGSIGNSPLCDYPLQVVPVEQSGNAIASLSAVPIAGVLQRMSPRTVTFAHDHAFAERIVVLKFHLSTNDQLAFVVEIIWTRKSDEGFTSSGAILTVGVPADQESESNIVESVPSV